MTEKERVLKVLNHEQADRIPLDMGSTGTTGIHAKAVHDLRIRLGLPPLIVKAHEPYQMLGLVEDDLANILELDVVGMQALNTMFGFRNENWKNWEMDMGLKVQVSEHFKTYRDDDGSTLIFPEGNTNAKPSGKMPKGGYFFDTIIRQYPIDEGQLNPQDNLEEFKPLTNEDILFYEQQASIFNHSSKAVVGSFGGTALGDIALVPAPFMSDPKGIRDITEWYMSTLTRQDYIHQVFNKQTEIAIENLSRISSVVKEAVQIVFVCGTDFGTQTGTFCSPKVYEDLYHPYYTRINDWIHQNTSWFTFKHSCGAVSSFIPLFIESGFDILNPVQISATGMDPMSLKQEFGKDIVFWGGGIDTQQTLPFGTPEEVRNEVLKNCEIFSRDGGFVFNTVHNIQGHTPVLNIISMLNALREFNGQPVLKTY